MSKIQHRRALLAAVQHLVKTNAPESSDYSAVIQALAQVLTDDFGVPVKVSARVNQKDVLAVIERAK